MAVKRDKQQIRDILALIEQADADVGEIASQAQRLQEAAAEAMESLRAKAVSGILRGMDVETVNRDHIGLRVSALRAAGIENMEQLCALSMDQINDVKGIGDDAALLIYTIAGRIRTRQEQKFQEQLEEYDRRRAKKARADLDEVYKGESLPPSQQRETASSGKAKGGKK